MIKQAASIDAAVDLVSSQTIKYASGIQRDPSDAHSYGNKVPCVTCVYI
jgi:hypothetical protein